MRIIDMHLNPLVEPNLGLVDSASLEDLRNASVHLSAKLTELSTERAVMVLLNPNILSQPDASSLLPTLAQSGQYVLSSTIPFRAGNAPELLERSHSLGIRGLKFHPYVQQITASDFQAIIALARQAESLGMFIMVCCSYGTRALDRHNGVELAARLSEQLSCSIIMSHAGGAKVLDALLVAADAPNLYLDTSFSLSYYQGSSVEQDFAFAMRKLGAERWVYGSDAPFCDPQDARNVALAFFDRHGFSSQEVETILHDTAARILAR